MRNLKLKSTFASLAFSLVFFGPHIVWASDAFEGLPSRSCSLNVLPPNEPISTTDLGSISGAVSEKNILLNDAPVNNQGDYGCCWISTTLAKWERETLKKFGKVIPLSENHMVLATLFYRIEEGIHYGSEISSGGWVQASEWMAAKVGLVPESAWKPKLDIRDKGIGKETHAYLNQEIAKFQAELVAMKESGKTEKEAWAAANKKKSELYKYMRERFGNFPSTFKVGGVEFTPNSFSKKIIGKRDGKSLFILTPLEEAVAKPAAGSAVKTVVTERSLFTLFPGVSKFLPVVKTNWIHPPES